MKAYFDTSAIVTLAAQEPRWPKLASWIERERPEAFFSDFGWGEFVSAVGLKVRRADIDTSEGRDVIARFYKYLSDWTKLCVTSNDLDRAAAMTSSFDLGLRFPDAIHIAVSIAGDCVLVSGDTHQVAAARHFNCPAINPFEA